MLDLVERLEDALRQAREQRLAAKELSATCGCHPICANCASMCQAAEHLVSYVEETVHEVRVLAGLDPT